MTREQLDARYLGRPGARVFSLSFQPRDAARGQVLYLPPFAEEMNRCRALASAQARQFAMAGYGCTLMDYCGTGDSEGQFEDVTLEDWLGNIDEVVEDIHQRHGQAPVLWGIRSGCLLAGLYASSASHPIPGLLLLQPVASGKRFVRQLVRQRIAAGVERGSGQISSDEIHRLWEDGQSLEIGGYSPSGALMLALEQLELTAFKLPDLPLLWLEHVNEGQVEPGLATAQALAALRAAGVRPELHCFSGPAIWQLNERAATPELLQLLKELYPL
ncbi:serine aminopeptidase domain-containing protein [Parahaliea aestuarii]|uniref:serine aminopeptidase domain-containing protein n=1 Tax=Parahaliea aestuarii TaxID=1852021 RepID=UPI00164EEF34|nr:alpha/beta hydrolase [Parahaliea aestuarii]